MGWRCHRSRSGHSRRWCHLRCSLRRSSRRRCHRRIHRSRSGHSRRRCHLRRSLRRSSRRRCHRRIHRRRCHRSRSGHSRRRCHLRRPLRRSHRHIIQCVKIIHFFIPFRESFTGSHHHININSHGLSFIRPYFASSLKESCSSDCSSLKIERSL